MLVPISRRRLANPRTSFYCRAQPRPWKDTFMKCPNCIAVDLLMTERKGIEIDYCPSCRGVWLDRGELEKFIQQADQPAQAQSWGRANSPEMRQQHDLAPGFDTDDDDDERKYGERGSRNDDSYYRRHGKKKESFWSNLFDFD